MTPAWSVDVSPVSDDVSPVVSGDLLWKPSRDELERLLTIRVVETRLQALCDQGLAGDLHFSKGQEAIAVGVCSALRSEDKIVTHHRTIAHEIARGAEIYPLVAEVLGRRTGMNRGRAGEMHLHNKAIGHAFSFQLVGTCLPVATGLAWAERFYRQTENVVVCFLGDAAFANGVVHEALTIAVVRRCPVVVVVEDNFLAGNIFANKYRGEWTWEQRFKGYSMPCIEIGGTDVETSNGAAREAVEHTRQSSHPTALVCRTHRLSWHKQGQRDYRLPTEVAEQARFDPIRVLQRRRGLSESDVESTRLEIEQRVDPIFAKALSDPPATLYYDE